MWFAVCVQDTLLMPQLLQNVFTPVCTEIVLFFVDELYVMISFDISGVKMAGYWPSTFFARFRDQSESRSINLQKKHELVVASVFNKL